MAKKAKDDVIEDLILDEDDDFDIEIDDTPPPGRTPGTQVLCFGNFGPDGKRDIFLGEIVRSVNFSKEFSHCGSSGKGFQIKFIEGSRPTPVHRLVGTKSGHKMVKTDDNIFLSARDVQTLNAANKRKWSRYKKSRRSGKTRKKKSKK